MKFILRPFLLIIPFFIFSACSEEEIDEIKPEITIDFVGGFPQACDQLQRGQTYTFSARVSDNLELAAYSIDIHHNFDHHTHDDQEGDCELDPKKSPEFPWIYMENFRIEPGLTSYDFKVVVTIPEDIDVGDYHCGYSVTDVTGWQSRTSIDFKIVE